MGGRGLRCCLPWLFGLAAGLFGACAQAGTIWGGQISEQRAVHTEAGFAHAEIGPRFPVGGRVELTPRFRFVFADALRLDLRLSAALDLRLQLGEAGQTTGFHAAVTLSLPVTLDPDRRSLGVGVGLLHPGLVMDYTFPSEVAFVLGARFEDDLYVRRGAVSFEGSVPFLFALEGQVTDFVRIGGKIEGGPAFGTGAGVRMLMRALLAVDVAF
jgi:hypothetical protein